MLHGSMAHFSSASSRRSHPSPETPLPVVVIGAGLTGLVVAQSLQQRGYETLVLEKSLGTGGRLNTRRVQSARADRGVRYLDGSLPLTAELMAPLLRRGTVKPWPGTGYQYLPSGLTVVDTENRYCAPDGISQVAKALLPGVEVWFNHRAIALVPPNPALTDSPWMIHCDHPRTGGTQPPEDEIFAAAVIVAIPAPQAEALLATISPVHCPAATDLLTAIAPVRYSRCISVTAAYAPARDLDPPALRDWQGIELPQDMTLAWIAREDRKQSTSDRPVVGLHSSAEFAERWSDAKDWYPLGRQMLARAEQVLNLPFRHPQDFQVHQWGYAQVINPIAQTHLHHTSADLWVGGDWCGGNNVEAALASGMAIAQAFDDAHNNSGITPDLGSLVAAPATVS